MADQPNQPKGPTVREVIEQLAASADEFKAVIVMGLNKDEQGLIVCSFSPIKDLIFLERVLNNHLSSLLKPSGAKPNLVEVPRIIPPGSILPGNLTPQ